QPSPLLYLSTYTTASPVSACYPSLLHFSRKAHLLFFFHHTATPEIYTLSLHDALPIWLWPSPSVLKMPSQRWSALLQHCCAKWRSEEHTSELQSRFDLVCRLLLEKKNIR